MPASRNVDLCVIGAGAAGLSVSAGAALLGLKVILVERGRMGGECLNTGCVPSKALLAAAKTTQAIRHAHSFGIDATPVIDFKRVHAHVHSVISEIAPHDSVERFEKFGVEVIRGDAQFLDRRTIAVDGQEIRTRRAVIATGSEPAIPSISGVEHVRLFTNETIFENDTLPKHLIILGGGPIGVELGQAFRRLGSAVTILEREKAMPKDDPELSRSLLQHLCAEGIAIRENAEVTAAAREGDEISIVVEEAGQSKQIRGSHLLVATGRRPRTNDLGLQAAGVEYDDKGIKVDEHLQTTARGIYAAGDVVDGPRFTHVCSYHAGIVIRNALFRFPAKLDYRSLPWVTYTDPELAQVGMTEEHAREKHADEVRVIRVPFNENDRAHTERRSEGLLKLIVHRRGHVLGASILGAGAGELTHLWVIAIEKKLRLHDVAQMIAPYPTWGELNKTAAFEFSKALLTSRLARTAVRMLSWLP
jgi:pyruvate/2-oxoglutarate dehydrogenase complex dihydrolipoamide dehydrogenase (E3) component